MDCHFCNKRNMGSHIILQSKLTYVIINPYPATEAHLLIVPKKHVRTISELNSEQYIDLFIMVEKATSIIRRRIQPKGINININEGGVAGQTLEHLHVHVIPRNVGDNLENFKRKNGKKDSLSKEERDVLKEILT